MSYKSDYDASAQRVASQQTRKTANQNITKSAQDVKTVRAEEATRREQGKPPARTP